MGCCKTQLLLCHYCTGYRSGSHAHPDDVEPPSSPLMALRLHHIHLGLLRPGSTGRGRAGGRAGRRAAHTGRHRDGTERFSLAGRSAPTFDSKSGLGAKLS